MSLGQNGKKKYRTSPSGKVLEYDGYKIESFGFVVLNLVTHN